MAESRSPYRDSYKPPFRLVGLIVFVSVIVGGYFIFRGVGETIFTNWLVGQCFSIKSQDKVEWLEKPHITSGYLEMSGETKDNALIHNVHAEWGTIYPAFSLVDIDSEEQQYTLLADIYPKNFETLNIDFGGNEMFAEWDGYDVSSSEFYVKAKLPAHVNLALDNDVKVAVFVWDWQEKTPEAILEPLGAECIER